MFIVDIAKRHIILLSGGAAGFLWIWEGLGGQGKASPPPNAASLFNLVGVCAACCMQNNLSEVAVCFYLQSQHCFASSY